MGLIEVEFEPDRFRSLVRLLAQAAPIPTATFSVLGDDRLIASLEWGSHDSEYEIVEGAPGLAPPPGVVLVRAPLIIGHVSIAELAAERPLHPATRTTQATAWLFVSVPPPRRRQLSVDLVRVDIAGRPTAAPFSPPLPLGKTQEFVPSDIPVIAAAVLQTQEAGTIRFATTPDANVLAPPADRLVALGGRG